ncbi:hypothetical protein MA16_Dca028477 [Dendrobium catenatum]|uniref:Uncharacterized protein n=1 Tax=Dendrobium catenatum TaxID=906689 RepID=A0A2I0VBK2_9ASPA|nr:hypothetical protein MA16_Dca028477 [Dendrobium catenatum]
MFKVYPRVIFYTRASHSFINHEFVKKHAFSVHNIPITLSVMLLDGSSVISTSMCSTLLFICEREFDVDLIILSLLEFDVILGMDWMPIIFRLYFDIFL